ncbi:MAG: putative Zn-dependent peptidase [Verrucomicrobiales bacterium]|jgi:predicted Zn-dependent peptidase
MTLLPPPLKSTHYHTADLPNGVQAAVTEMPFMESVSLGIWAGIGSRHESDELSGIAHFVEHMVFKGTKNRTARQLTTEVEAAGGRIEAYTMADQTCYYIKGPAETFPRFLDVLTDLYQNAVFPEEDVEREREVIREEIVMYREQPNQHIEDLLGMAAWPGNPLGRPITGTEESITRIDGKGMHEFVRNNYTGNRSIISVAGRVTAAEVMPLLQEKLSSLPGGEKRATSDAPTVSRPQMLFDQRKTEQVQLALGFPCWGRFDDQLEPLRLLQVLLGGSMSSRLWQKLREDRGLCYEVQADLLTLDDVGLFQVYAGVDASNVDETLRLILAELRDLADNGPSKQELDEACQYATGTQRIALENTSTQMMWAGESLLSYGKVIDPDKARKALDAVTVEAVGKAAKDCFTHNNLAAAFVGNASNTSAIESILKSW